MRPSAGPTEAEPHGNAAHEPQPPRQRSAGRARYLLVLLIMMLAGAWSGQMVSHQLWHDKDADVLVDCILQAVTTAPGGASDREVDGAIRSCKRSKQGRRFLMMGGGSVAVGGFGVVLMFLLPRRYVRRAGPLRDVPDAWSKVARTVATEIGTQVDDNVRITFGGVRLRVPFTVRHGRRVCIVLPRAVTNLPLSQAKALLRHELAHVAAGDVTLVWLSIGLWVALVPVLAVPVIVAVFQGRFVPVTFIGDLNLSWSDYTLRSVVLLVTAGLVFLAILRTREHEADLLGRESERADMEALLLSNPPSRQPAWWRTPFAIHPSPKRRGEAIRTPHLAARTPVTDLAVVVFSTTLTTAASGTVGFQLGLATDALYQFGVVSVVQGLAIGLTWALPAWRNTISNSEAASKQRYPSVWLPLLGLAIGVTLGLAISDVNQDPALKITASLTTVGAGILSLAAARVWTRRGVTGGAARPVWIVVGVFNVLLFAGAYWFGLNMSTNDPGDRWVDLYWNAALVPDALAPQALWFLAVTLFGWWWIIHARRTAQIGPPVLVVLTSAVAAATTMLLKFHSESPPANGAVGGYQVVTTAAIAGLACFIALLLVGGPDAFGAALGSALLSIIIVSMSFGLEYYSGIAHLFSVQTRLIEIEGSVLAPALLTVALPLAVLPGWNYRRPAMLTWMAPVLASVAAFAVSMALPAPAFVG